MAADSTNRRNGQRYRREHDAKKHEKRGYSRSERTHALIALLQHHADRTAFAGAVVMCMLCNDEDRAEHGNAAQNCHQNSDQSAFICYVTMVIYSRSESENF